MLNLFEQLPYRRVLFIAFTLIVLGVSAFELISEFGNGEPLVEMLDDLAMFTISAVIVALFGLEHVAQQRSMHQLREQLDSARGRLADVDAQSTHIANQYRAVMQKQFELWQLTPSEQDVVLALLKGLSFREVAELRETREKTVRQQATSVYRKANVAGRHELAAWFFEDMLEPPVINR